MKLKFIDSIRGIAILMVILVHSSQSIHFKIFFLQFITNYGQLGVQLFFVASAYTLCMSSENRKNEDNHLLKFAIRRYFRIAPAYYLGILIYFVIKVALIKYSTGNFSIPKEYNFLNVFSNIAFFHGFYEPGNNTIVPGGWSIGTEMAFYAIFPFLFKVASTKIKNGLGIIFFVLLGIGFSLLVIYLLYLFGFNIKKNYFIYFNIINQLPVFIVGISYYLYREKLKMDWNHRFDFLFFILFLIISLTLFYFNFNFIFPFSSAFAFIFLIEIFRNHNFLNNKVLVRIGQVSFSMYLLHFIFASYLAPIIISKINFQNDIIAFMSIYFLIVLVTFICALFSEKIVEKPGIEIGRRLIKKI